MGLRDSQKCDQIHKNVNNRGGLNPRENSNINNWRTDSNRENLWA